jgi:hypothetical protein
MITKEKYAYRRFFFRDHDRPETPATSVISDDAVANCDNRDVPRNMNHMRHSFHRRGRTLNLIITFSNQNSTICDFFDP